MHVCVSDWRTGAFSPGGAPVSMIVLHLGISSSILVISLFTCRSDAISSGGSTGATHYWQVKRAKMGVFKRDFRICETPCRSQTPRKEGCWIFPTCVFHAYLESRRTLATWLHYLSDSFTEQIRSLHWQFRSYSTVFISIWRTLT